MKKVKRLSSMALALAMTFSIGITNSTHASTIKYGDCNSDSIVDKSDYTTLKAYLLGITSTINVEASDVNLDKKINICDYIILSKYLNGVISGLPYVDGQVVTPTNPENPKHFIDEFNFFNTDIWSKSDGWSNGSMFNCTWRADNVNLSDGNMTLMLDKDTQGGTVPYASAEYRSSATYGYGLFQTNMKPAKNPGIVSSFFTYTGPSDNAPWDEIDIEFLGKDTTKVQFNYFTNGVGNHEYVYDLGFDASTSFHTYAFNWQPTYIAWLVDGKEVHRATSDIPSHPSKIMMNLWPGIGVDGWLGAYNGQTPIKAYYNWASYD